MFLRKLLETQVLANTGRIGFELKFGAAIDQDNHESTWVSLVGGVIEVTESIEWDARGNASSVAELCDILGDDERTIYRGYLSLGAASDNACEALSRLDSPENDVDFAPDSWSLSLGPVMMENQDSRFQVGWLDLSVSGNGYLFPWTASDVIERILQSPEMCAATDLCRSTWPVAIEAPTAAELQMRKKLGENWPYDEFHKPTDWLWGINESL